MTSKAQGSQRPLSARSPTTPPISPACKGSPAQGTVRSSGAMTPPETPTRSDSVTSVRMVGNENKPGASGQGRNESNKSREGVLAYTGEELDYELVKDMRLGSGRFSQVYLARRISPNTYGSLPTPPTSPAVPTTQHARSEPDPTLYAVKVAIDKQSFKTLRGEARILSYLFEDRNSRKHLVPFYGLDTRQNALVFAALPASLADLISNELNTLHLASRTARLCMLLPHIARSLTAGLAWMHSLDVVHADIKPPNILLRADVPVQVPLVDEQRMIDIPFTPVFADFTSAFLTTDDPKSISSVGGGTYDYMAPEQLRPPFPIPNFKMDVYALAISMLETISGSSPFRVAGSNRNMKMAMVQEANAMSWSMRNSTSKSRIRAISAAMLENNKTDVLALLQLGLKKNPEERLSAEEWSLLW